MAGSAKIKAGEAFWEATVRDNTGAGLKSAQGKLAAFSGGLKAMASPAAAALAAVGASLAAIGAALAVAGGGIAAIMAKSVQTFMDVSKHAKETGMAIAGIDPSKAQRLSAAWDTLKATLGAIQFLIGDAIAEPLTRVIELFISWGMELANVVAQNKELLTSIGEWVSFVATALTDIPGAFGVAFNWISVAWVAVTEGMKLAMLRAMEFVVAQVRAAVATISQFITGVGATIDHLGGGTKIRDLGVSIGKAGQALAVPQAVLGAGADAQAGNMANKMAESIAKFAVGAVSQRDEINSRLASVRQFSSRVAGPQRLLGSAQGTFSGAAASLFGVGPGGGQKVSDDKSHELLGRIIKAVNGLEVGQTFN